MPTEFPQLSRKVPFPPGNTVCSDYSVTLSDLGNELHAAAEKKNIHPQTQLHHPPAPTHTQPTHTPSSESLQLCGKAHNI